MLSYSSYSAVRYNTDALPKSQMAPCIKTDTYVYVRSRLGKQTVTASGHTYGPYLYRNTRTNVLIASGEKPDKLVDSLYSWCDIGMNADALTYYKNT
jgi:hypothetical protein